VPRGRSAAGKPDGRRAPIARREAKHPPRSGPSSRLEDPGFVAGFINDLRAGAFIGPTCDRWGISRRIYYRWIERGEASLRAQEEAEDAGLPVPEPDEPYHTFTIEQAGARAQAEIAALVRIRNAAQDRKVTQIDRHGDPVEVTIPGDWRADAWFMEHGPGRERWATRVEVAGDADRPLTVRAEPQPVYPPTVHIATVLAALAEAGVGVAIDPTRIIEATASD
jgi:hypothetical protein